MTDVREFINIGFLGVLWLWLGWAYGYGLMDGWLFALVSGIVAIMFGLAGGAAMIKGLLSSVFGGILG